MQRDTGKSPSHEAELKREIDALNQRVSLREARIGELERLVQQQMTMLDRYDQAIADFAERGPFRPQERHLNSEEYERVIALLDRAIARAEQLTSDKQRLETHLEKTLALLDEALKNQERMAERTREIEAAAPLAAGGDQAASIEATLAKYDAMLERSLEALEAAYRSNRDQQKEIGERDRLISRTLDALENAVGEQESSQPARSGRRGVLNSLLG